MLKKFARNTILVAATIWPWPAMLARNSTVASLKRVTGGPVRRVRSAGEFTAMIHGPSQIAPG